ncbi:hypothetical protein [Enterocloster clostridioformis]|nr:hypothetical protein [Enterocloster clostridioformis]
MLQYQYISCIRGWGWLSSGDFTDRYQFGFSVLESTILPLLPVL